MPYPSFGGRIRRCLAGFSFNELAEKRNAVGFGEPAYRRPLRLDTRARALLPLC